MAQFSVGLMTWYVPGSDPGTDHRARLMSSHHLVRGAEKSPLTGPLTIAQRVRESQNLRVTIRIGIVD